MSDQDKNTNSASDTVSEVESEELTPERFREIILDLEVAKKKEIEQRIFSESLVNGLKSLTSSDSTSSIFLNLLESLKDVLSFDTAMVLKKDSFGVLYNTIITTDPIFDEAIWKEGKVFKRLMKGKPIVLNSVGKTDEWKNRSDEVKSYASSILYIPIVSKENHVILSFLKKDTNFANSHKELALKLIPLVTSALVNTEKNDLIKEKSKATQALFKSLPVGVLTLTGEGHINPEYSKICDEIFERDDIANKTIYEVLLNNSTLSVEEQSMMRSTLELSIGFDELNFDVNMSCLVQEITVEVNNHTKYIDLTWSCVTDDDENVTQVILVMKDVTILKDLEMNAKNKSKELELFSQLLSSEPEYLTPALMDFQKMISDLKGFSDNLDRENFGIIKRILHTIKGNARTFTLDMLSSTVHEVESSLNFDDQNLSDIYDSSLSLIEEVFEDYKKVAKKLHLFDDANIDEDIDHLTVDLDDKAKQSLDTLYQDITSNKKNLDEGVLSIIHSLQMSRAQYLNKALKMSIKSLGDISVNLDKEMPDVVFTGEQYPIFTKYKSILEDSFGHLFRNSLDHGLETTGVRLEVGKSKNGRIEINTKLKDGRVLLTFKDDGKGLNVSKIKEKGIAANCIDSNCNDVQEISNLIFKPEFSSRDEVTINSGRGVGMDAVVNFLKSIDSSIELIPSGEVNSKGFCEFYFEISLPKDIFYFPIINGAES